MKRPGWFAIVCLLGTAIFATHGGMMALRDWFGVPTWLGALAAGLAAYVSYSVLRMDGYDSGYDEGRDDQRNDLPDRR